jgi:glycosyltransferase involved in cell wall biosynthesis
VGGLVIPVALFAYKRADHLERTINSLKKNYLSEKIHLHVFSDGPKKSEDRACVEKVRAYIQTLTGFAKITVIISPENRGLSKSIISGVSRVLESYDRVIVIEDDLELSPYFLAYMNEALNLYQDNLQVASIHGYTLPVKTKLPDTFFLKGADCWGWGTWKRAWNTFEQDGRILLNNLNHGGTVREFDWGGLVGNTKMLKDQIAGKNDSWAIRWHASCFLNKMLTLHPGKSLVKNIGFDGTGEHCNTDNTYDTELSSNNIILELQSILESEIGHKIYKEFFYQNLKPTFVKRLKRKVKSFLLKNR